MEGESHKLTDPDENNLRTLAKAYYVAKEAVIRWGFGDELDWQYNVSLDLLTENDFLREAAWVILSSGMSERVIRLKFPGVSRAFYDWTSAERIVANAPDCKAEAFNHFRHSMKIDAVITLATHICERGFSSVRQRVTEDGVLYLSQFPFLGPATSYHLAKNIGLAVAKPDRHLKRIALTLGYRSVQHLCADISTITDEPVPIVDLVLWRFAVHQSRYLRRLSKS